MADKPDISMVDNRSIEDGDRPDKPSASRVIANIHVLGLNDDDAEFYETFPPERRSKLVRKVVSDLNAVQSFLLQYEGISADVQILLGLAPRPNACLPIPYLPTRPSKHRKCED